MAQRDYQGNIFRDRIELKKPSSLQVTPRKQMKILFIGNSGVGKSSLVHRLRKDEFLTVPRNPTISFTPNLLGAEFDRENYLVELQDTAGEERYNAIFGDFYRHAHGAMIVYDITNYQSYERVMFWMMEVKRYARNKDVAKFPFLLLGNKVDKNERHIDGTNVAEDLEMNGFIKTSAKSGEGIREAIKLMIGLIVTKYSDQELEIPREIPNDMGNNIIKLPAHYGQVQVQPDNKCTCVI